MPEYRVLVTGSRDWDDYAVIREEIGAVVAERMAITASPYPLIVVVHGKARGADMLADRAAREFGLLVEGHRADWGRHGKAAGYKRNAEMVALGAGRCLAFYKQGAGNRGTDHCARLAEAAGIPVRRYTAP